MKKHQLIPVILLSVFMLVSSFVLLKLEKKQTPLAVYPVILKNSTANADAILQAYGNSIYQITPLALQRNDSRGHSLFLESKLYASTVNKPIMHYCDGDTSLAVTIYTKQGIMDNNTPNNKLAAVLIKYQ